MFRGNLESFALRCLDVEDRLVNPRALCKVAEPLLRRAAEAAASIQGR